MLIWRCNNVANNNILNKISNKKQTIEIINFVYLTTHFCSLSNMEGFCDSDGIYSPRGMPAGGRDLIKQEYVELCMKRGRRHNIANNTTYSSHTGYIHKHTYYNLTVLSVPNTTPNTMPTVIFSYWMSSEKKAIDECIEKFDQRLRLDEQCRDCRAKNGQHAKKRFRKQSDS